VTNFDDDSSNEWSAKEDAWQAAALRRHSLPLYTTLH
jgi:hypothetical protein